MLAKDTIELKTIDGQQLNLCYAGLMNEARYPWVILVPKIEGAVELIDLNSKDRYQLLDEISHVSKAMQKIFKPYKLNVANLGNIVQQLHIHIIARQKTDHAWPGPIWGVGEVVPYSEEELEKMKRLIEIAT